MTVRNQIRMEFMAVAENVGLARLVCAQAAAGTPLSLQDVEDLKVAVSEAVSNAIIHGYNRDPGGLVRLMITREEERLEIIVEDDGVGIEDVEKAMEPTFSQDPERMGLGFVFMKTFMDGLEVESVRGRGTRVRLVKELAAEAAAQSVQ